MAEELLKTTEELDGFSFYGLSHHLTAVQKLLERAAIARASKKPSSEDAELLSQHESLLDAQSRLRRAMGSCLDSPSLTKREKPLAEDFLQQQLKKLEGQAGNKAKDGVERLKSLLAAVRASPQVAESREVQQAETSIKQLDADWKELGPLHDRWQAGRHTFKSNTELQAFRRRYDDCVKARGGSSDKLQRALCVARTSRNTVAPQDSSWSAASKAPARAPRPSQGRWGSAVVSFAQRLRAEVGARVRDEVQSEQAQQEPEEREPSPRPRPPPPPPPPPKAAPIVAKRPPPLPPEAIAATAKAPAAAPAPVLPEPQEEFVEEEEPQQDQEPQYAASAKKKSKVKKRKGREQEDEAAAPTREAPRPPSWVATAKEAFAGALLPDILRQDAWSMFRAEEQAELRLEELVERLPWSSPLGLRLPLEWTELLGLEIDGGPRRTSKRGTPQWVLRLQRNVPWLLGHYITVFFLLTVLHATSHFGILLWAAGLQAALILAPPESLKAPVRVLALQGAHLLLWLLFAREVWLMHMLVKLLLAALVAAHAYVVASPAEG